MTDIFCFVLLKRAGRHFGFFKRAGRHEKGAGCRALQKKPRQNTDTYYIQFGVIYPQSNNIHLTRFNIHTRMVSTWRQRVHQDAWRDVNDAANIYTAGRTRSDDQQMREEGSTIDRERDDIRRHVCE